MTGQSPDEFQLTNKVNAPQNGDELQKLVNYVSDCDECEIRIVGFDDMFPSSVFQDARLIMTFGSNLVTFFYNSSGQFVATNPNGSGSSPLPTAWIPASDIGLISVEVTNIPPGIPSPTLFYRNLADQLGFDFELRCPETTGGKQQVLSYLTYSDDWSLFEEFTITDDTESTANADLPLPCPNNVDEPSPIFFEPTP